MADDTTTTNPLKYRENQKFGGDETGFSEYQRKFNNIISAVESGQMDPTEADARIKELQAQEFGPSSFDIGEFEDLLSRLEGSKIRQQRQKSVEGRRDIMTQGLAGMMGNF